MKDFVTGSKYEETKEKIIDSVVRDILCRNEAFRDAYNSFKVGRTRVYADNPLRDTCYHCRERREGNIIEVMTYGPSFTLVRTEQEPLLTTESTADYTELKMDCSNPKKEHIPYHYFHERCLDNLVGNALKELNSKLVNQIKAS